MSAQTLREISQVRLGPEDEPEFQIAPMIDILLVMLVFFMSISSAAVLQSSKGVTLPVADVPQPRPATRGQLIVNVTWSRINDAGQLEIDGRTFTRPEEILDLLRVKAQANPGMRILLRADRDARYEYLKRVMIVVGHAGVGKVTFSVTGSNPPVPVY